MYAPDLQVSKTHLSPNLGNGFNVIIGEKYLDNNFFEGNST